LVLVALPSVAGATPALTKPALTKPAVTNPAVAKQPAAAPKKVKAMPTFAAVTALVSGQLKANRYYKPGDVLSRGNVDPIFSKLAGLGWVVSDRKQILEQLLPDDYYLVRALRSPDNSMFMRQVGRVPDGYAYDRLDRISRMGDGQVLVNRIMQEPGGWNFIDIMSETREAPGIAQAFSMGPGGKDFTKPTGRIYTEQQFLARLKQSYDKATKGKPSAKEPSAKKP
jgi:hypothetical protein